MRCTIVAVFTAATLLGWGLSVDTASGQIPEDALKTYIQARQQLEKDDPAMRRAIQAGDFSGRKDNIRSVLAGSPMTVEEFIQVHEQVQRDPALKSRVEAQLGATGVSGARPGASPQ